jgi:hypothetical protein
VLQNFVTEWLSKLDPSSLLLGGLVGAFLSTWYNFFIKRPKLEICGGGSGGATYVRLRNKPGFIGIVFRENTIFGFRLNSRIEWGLTVDRSAARDCSASILDKETGESILPLWWRISHSIVEHTITLDAGDAADLLLASTQQAAADSYYIWQPTGNGALTPAIPPAQAQFQGPREFIVEIRHSDGRVKMRFPLKITRRYDGTYAYAHPGGGGSPL